MRTNGLRLVCFMALAWVLAFAGTAHGESAPAADGYRIVALGDSLTAGYEPGMTEKSVPYGYTDRFREQALFHGRAKLGNFAILGLRTDGLLNLLQGAQDGKVLKAADIQDFADPRVAAMAEGIGARTAELRQSLAEANVVLMTIGANDFSDFLRSLLNESAQDAAAAFENDFNTILNKYAEEAEKTVRLTAELAPNARILLADQYLPLPKLFAPDLYDLLYEKAVSPLTATVDALTAKLQAEGINVLPVHVAEKFKGREGGLTHMSVSLEGDAKPDIHPTQAGYEAMAEAFSQAMWQEYRKPAKRPAGVPISVVVGGKEVITANKPVVKPPGVTFLALRDISDAMGAELSWNEKTKTAVFRQNGREVSITIDSKTMVVNGAEQPLSTPAYLQPVGKEKKTYVPLAVIAGGLNYEVDYSKNLQTAFINP
ncbi:stalk domain-containing protein [Cohnella sp. CFH 77786]|uniref:stalk domain-containing protein n=1 Tax=Cohnella sp. CFH 77786 TaxID=2662265 RepID=UPI001C608707|nr:stalk domain-containing protein [Cohnella sp. CFH 77786]